MKARSNHCSVLPQAILDVLQVQPHGQYLDATVGHGGHTLLLLQKLRSTGRVYGLDVDPQALLLAQKKTEQYSNVTLAQGNFAQLEKYFQKWDLLWVDGIIFDLGFSQWQITDPQRGFSYHQTDALLDMRMNPQLTVTAADILNSASVQQLTKIFCEWGEEPRAFYLAKKIVAARQDTLFRTVGQLVHLVKKNLPYYRRRIGHPARKVFQALRIAVNDELHCLSQGIWAAARVLKPGGRLAIITFHSLEDRLVKQLFTRLVCYGLTNDPTRAEIMDYLGKSAHQQSVFSWVTKKAITPNASEILANRQARSAKLRAIMKRY